MNGERYYLSEQMVLAQLDMHILKNVPQPLPHTRHKNELKWIIKLKAKKYFKNNVKGNPCNLGLEKNFIHRISKAETMKNFQIGLHQT